jgi:hypothetical protein
MSAERSGPAICNVSNIGEGKDEMTKASIDLQDLRRRIYVKAKAEPSWQFWGLINRDEHASKPNIAADLADKTACPMRNKQRRNCEATEYVF